MLGWVRCADGSGVGMGKVWGWVRCEDGSGVKIFAVFYRNLNQSQAELEDFMINFELMLSKMVAENPYCVIITGGFNSRSAPWWRHDMENDVGRLFEPSTADLGLEQPISKPTHFIEESQ